MNVSNTQTNPSTQKPGPGLGRLAKKSLRVLGTLGTLALTEAVSTTNKVVNQTATNETGHVKADFTGAAEVNVTYEPSVYFQDFDQNQVYTLLASAVAVGGALVYGLYSYLNMASKVRGFKKDNVAIILV